ncbi:MAG TPA: hypothetical protein VGP13_03040 [Candidatus Paceibacterota bacterium]|jgi:hypothetical protein|nr:hypothetical protein [Candidatus Paceibacterota bacterium]
MHHIGKHIAGQAPQKKKGRDNERGELMQYFMERLNRSRGRGGLPLLTMPRMGRLLVAIPTKDLYFLKSVCDDAETRSGSVDTFSKKFWWEIKPRKEEKK